MRFKKVYIEITNRCNLNCSFCKNNSRYKEDMSLDKFEIVLKEKTGHAKFKLSAFNTTGDIDIDFVNKVT